ncbi:hypothetical protein P9112_005320 [Eukaryota sp. TZLM1-RC]
MQTLDSSIHSLLQDALRKDLQKQSITRDHLNTELMHFQNLQKTLTHIVETGSMELTSLVDLGSSVFSEAHVPDTSTVFVEVGLGFHAEFLPSEALAHCKYMEEDLKRRISQIESNIGDLTCKISNVERDLKQFFS